MSNCPCPMIPLLAAQLLLACGATAAIAQSGDKPVDPKDAAVEAALERYAERQQQSGATMAHPGGAGGSRIEHGHLLGRTNRMRRRR